MKVRSLKGLIEKTTETHPRTKKNEKKDEKKQKTKDRLSKCPCRALPKKSSVRKSTGTLFTCTSLMQPSKFLETPAVCATSLTFE